ncbi:MAG: hypothetical protein AABZ33_04855 [Chloroflexota bacterium]
MTVGVPAVERARARVSLGDAQALVWLARLLLVAVALDLVVTRFVVRLAIFVPKGEPWATASGVLGRIGAATDAAVPLVGLVVLGVLLVDAGRRRRPLDAATLAAIAVVAFAGFAFIVLPPRVEVALVLEVVVALVAVAAAVRIGRTRGPIVARVGVIGLAAGVGFAAISGAVELSGVAAASGGSLGLTLAAVGQLAFVAGALLVGSGGLVRSGRPEPARGRFVLLGLAAALFVVVMAWRAPSMWGVLSIWSIGLAGAVPVPLVAIAIGFAAGGLPLLHRRSLGLAIGAAIVLLSGYDLAASGLLLAQLLGLAIAGTLDHHGHGDAPQGSSGRRRVCRTG